MNSAKVNVYKNVLQRVCEQFKGAEGSIKERIDQLGSNGNISL